jgi:predicted nucleic acid-binding protein
MTALVFVDTNVLVYQLDSREPAKQLRARGWLDYLWAARTGRISSQVLQELYVTVTRKLEPGLELDAARKVVRSLWSSAVSERPGEFRTVSVCPGGMLSSSLQRNWPSAQPC